MQLNQPELSIQRNNLPSESHNFDISSNDIAIILEILRSKLYQNPIEAMCRELIANAYDAHVEKGDKDTPIRIVLPTPLEPMLRIQDFGVGISENRIADVFVKFGASTKRNTNEAIGAFGIGAKSPFAYTDTFTIATTTSVDKPLRQYVAHIDETRKGSLQFMGTTPNTEKVTGTTITIPVKKNDFEKIKSYVEFNTLFMEVTPDIVGSSLLAKTFKQIKPTYSEPGWELYAKKALNDFSEISRFFEGPIVLIGIVPYPIKIQLLAGKLKEYGLTLNQIAALKSASLLIKADIGDLTLSANRESLHYDNDTIEYLSIGIQWIVERILTKFELELQSQKNWTAAFYYAEAKLSSARQHSHRQNLLSSIVGKGISTVKRKKYSQDILHYQNIPLCSQIIFDPEVCTVQTISLISGKQVCKSLARINRVVGDRLSVFQTRYSPNSLVNEENIIIFNDLETPRLKSSIKEKIQNTFPHSKKFFYVINPTVKPEPDWVVPTFESICEAEPVLKDLKIIKASDYLEKSKTKRKRGAFKQKTKANETKVYMYDPSAKNISRNGIYYNFNPKVIDLKEDKTGIFCYITNLRSSSTACDLDNLSLNLLKSYCESQNIKLVAIRRNYSNIFENLEGWVHAKKKIESILKERILKFLDVLEITLPSNMDLLKAFSYIYRYYCDIKGKLRKTNYSSFAKLSVIFDNIEIPQELKSSQVLRLYQNAKKIRELNVAIQSLESNNNTLLLISQRVSVNVRSFKIPKHSLGKLKEYEKAFDSFKGTYLFKGYRVENKNLSKETSYILKLSTLTQEKEVPCFTRPIILKILKGEIYDSTSHNS